MGILSRSRRQSSDDDEPLDPDERSPQLGLRYKDLFVLNAMVEQGWDLDNPREVEYSLYFGSAGDAAAAADALRNVGFDVTESAPSTEITQGSVIATRPNAVLAFDFVRETDDLMRAVAADHHGTYDGWGAGA